MPRTPQTRPWLSMYSQRIIAFQPAPQAVMQPVTRPGSTAGTNTRRRKSVPRSPRLADASRSLLRERGRGAEHVEEHVPEHRRQREQHRAAFMPRPQVTSTTMSGKNAVAGTLARIWMTASDGLRQFGLRPSQ